MRRALLVVVTLIAAMIAVIATAGAWLLYSEAGLAWSLRRLTNAVDGLVIEAPTGSWSGGVNARRIDYRSSGLDLHADTIRLELSPLSLLIAEPRIAALGIERLVVVMRDTDDKPKGRPGSLALPVSVDISQVRIGQLEVTHGDRTDTLRDVSVSYAARSQYHELREFAATHAWGAVRLQGRLATRPPHELKGALDLDLHAPSPLAVVAQLHGPLEALAVQAQMRHPAVQIELNGLVAPYDANPLARIDAAYEGLDLRNVEGALPHSAIAAQLRLVADGDRQWAGSLTARNDAAGPWDKERVPVSALRTRLTLGTSSARLTELELALGAAGRAAGSATLAPGNATVALNLHTVDLRGLHSALRATQLQGRIAATIAPERQSASAVLAQDDLNLSLDVHRSGDEVVVPRYLARARGSTASGKARVVLAGDKPYAAVAMLEAFDPAAWGNFPSARLSGRIDVEGELARDDLRLQYALVKSQLLGASFDSAGRLRYGGERLSGVDVRVNWGGNRVGATGGFGAPGDRLSLNIEAPTLAVVHSRLRGGASGTAVFAGTLRAPTVDAQLQLRTFAYGAVALVNRAAIAGTYDGRGAGTVRVSLHAEDVKAAGWSWQAVDLRATGTRQAHAIELTARGPDVDFGTRVRGSWAGGRNWTGVIEQAANRGSVPFAVAQPITVRVSAQEMFVGPFAAQVLDGEFQTDGFRYRNGALDTAGRFARLPVRALASVAGIRLTPQDDLRLNGSWSVQRQERLAIALRVERESGDLILPGDRPLAAGLQMLRAEAQLRGGQLQVQAQLRSALANGSLDGRIQTTGQGADERIARTSPVAFRAQIDIARLAALTPLAGGNAYVDGQAQAVLEGSGTLEKPVVGGTLTADRLVIALPPEGIDLREGRLRADIQANRIAVREFRINGPTGVLTAQGTLALEGEERAALDWRAERLMLLARPDRRLVVTGNGRAALDRGRLALTGSLRADEGLFRFGTRALPTLGPDVIVAGRTVPREEDKKLSRAALDLTLDFGNDLHLIGQGLDAWISGRVVLTNPGGELVARGTVRTQRGTYTAFGQRLQIDRGQLTFNGAADNPALDILAMRKNQAVEAGVAVTGTVRTPLVRVVSEPAVSEGEALSWLMLGRGPADASRADLAMLPLAAASLFGKGQPGGTSIASRFGLDTLAVRGSGGGNANAGALSNQVVAVGKRISHRLYVIYEQGLGGATNVLKIEYNLSRRLVLRAEAGEVSAAGLFFRHVFD